MTGSYVRFEAKLVVTPTGRCWPFSEVRERLLNMLVVQRVRFALYRRSLRGR
jgi:hypothetical protein